MGFYFGVKQTTSSPCLKPFQQFPITLGKKSKLFNKAHEALPAPHPADFSNLSLRLSFSAPKHGGLDLPQTGQHGPSSGERHLWISLPRALFPMDFPRPTPPRPSELHPNVTSLGGPSLMNLQDQREKSRAWGRASRRQGAFRTDCSNRNNLNEDVLSRWTGCPSGQAGTVLPTFTSASPGPGAPPVWAETDQTQPLSWCFQGSQLPV